MSERTVGSEFSSFCGRVYDTRMRSLELQQRQSRAFTKQYRDINMTLEMF
jgi:hypothetical protein